MSFGQSVPGLGKERLEALTDGIFATVMTVLVLSLSVPVITDGTTNAQDATDIEALTPNILAYILGFLMLAVLWISHHSIFHYMTRVDRPLLWLNTVFLLTVGFLPFSTALVGRYPQFQGARSNFREQYHRDKFLYAGYSFLFQPDRVAGRSRTRRNEYG